MLSSVIYDSQKDEMKIVRRISGDCFAHLSEDELECSMVSDYSEAEKMIDHEVMSILDTAMLEVVSDQGIALAKKTRSEFKQSAIMILSDLKISPMKYMIPEIQAASLLLRPFSKEQAEQAIKGFYQSVLEAQEDTDRDDKASFVIENQDGKTKIPYSQIYYFEVNEKKIYVRLKNREFSQYDTMENLGKNLPEQFIRCHRSYIVNTDLITRVKLSEGMIYLADDITVPLSRSYKAEIKEYLNEIRK